jgi:hypothetical protein
MFGVEGHMIPPVPLLVVGRVIRVAVLLLLEDERPLLVELHLTGPGGKRHAFVVELPGVVAGQTVVADHRVGVHPDQPNGGVDAVALGQVPQPRDGLVLGQLRAE